MFLHSIPTTHSPTHSLPLVPHFPASLPSLLSPLQVDADGSGDLDPDELVPIILEVMQQNGGTPPSHDLCVQFCQLFDDDGNGVLDREEFVALHR